MMHKITLYLIMTCCLGFILASCNNNELIRGDDGIIKYVPCEWQYPLQKGDDFKSNSHIESNLIHEGNVVLPIAEADGTTKLAYVEGKTGNELWRWRDVIMDSEKVNIYEAYIYDDKMLYVTGSRHYAIDLKNGTTYWRIQRKSSFGNFISGIGEKYYVYSFPRDTLKNFRTKALFEGNVYTGEIEQFLLTDIDTTIVGEMNLVTTIAYFRPLEYQGRQYMMIVNSQPYPDWYYSISLGLYDLSEEKWKFNLKLVSEKDWSNTLSNLVFYDEKIYLTAGKDLACHDFHTGEQIWNRNFSHDFLFSGFIVKEGIVVANCENEVLYGLDAETGNTLWEGQGAGTSSELKDRYLNGIVYFSGGSTSRIHAVDIHTGETVWLLEANEYDSDVHDFKRDILVIPGENGEKGKVVITTHWDAYCLEAYR